MALLVLLPLLAGASGIPQPPAATPGDYSQLHGHLSLNNGGSNEVVSATLVVGPDRVTVNGTTYDAIKRIQNITSWSNTTVYGQTYHHETWTNVTSWIRASDGALIRTDAAPTQGYASTTVYDPPCPGLQFPLEVGQQWTTSCTKITTVNRTGQVTTTQITTDYAVLREEQVTVAAGTFDALVIETNATMAAKEDTWYSPQACGYVKIVAPTAQGDFVDELTDYSCANPSGATSTTTTGGGNATTNATTNATGNSTGVGVDANATTNATLGGGNQTATNGTGNQTTTKGNDTSGGNSTTTGTSNGSQETHVTPPPTTTTPPPVSSTPPPVSSTPPPVSSTPVSSTPPASTSPAAATPTLQPAATTPVSPSTDGGTGAKKVPGAEIVLALGAVGLLAVALRRR